MKDGNVYPLMDHAADKLRAASGRPLNEIDLAAAAGGELAPDDLRISAETLRAQAQIASQAGYNQLAANLNRAAELTVVPNEELLLMYEALRPGRASHKVLLALAQTLEEKYDAPLNAQFVREAAEVYRERKLLKKG